jgi:hypothetical protein
VISEETNLSFQTVRTIIGRKARSDQTTARRLETIDPEQAVTNEWKVVSERAIRFPSALRRRYQRAARCSSWRRCSEGKNDQAKGERKLMLSEPGFWLIIAGSLLVAVAFIDLAFNRIGCETPVDGVKLEEQQLQLELPNPLSTKTEVAKVFGRAGTNRTG